jgi:hypothetical protein
MGGIVHAAHKLAPALEDLLRALAPHLKVAADDLGVEE